MKIIRLPTVVERTGLPKSSIYSLLKSDLFPKQVRLGVRSVGWRESDVEAWISNRTEVNNSGHSA
jgi:prophage regulatory protein